MHQFDTYIFFLLKMKMKVLVAVEKNKNEIIKYFRLFEIKSHTNGNIYRAIEYLIDGV